MSSTITSLSGLYTEITRLIDGEDPETSDLSVETLTRLTIVAQQRLYRDVRSRWNEKSFTGVTVASNLAALPSDFESPSIVHFGGKALVPVSEQVIHDYQAGAAGTEKYFAVAGSSFTFWPAIADGTALQGRYFARLPRLTDTNISTNELFQNADDVFIYAALAESEPFLGKAEKLPQWEAKYAQIVERLNFRTDRAAYSAGRLRIRPSVAICGGNRQRTA